MILCCVFDIIFKLRKSETCCLFIFLEQLKKALEEWKSTDESFVSTYAAKFILESIKQNNCVTITGISGMWKTAKH